MHSIIICIVALQAFSLSCMDRDNQNQPCVRFSSKARCALVATTLFAYSTIAQYTSCNTMDKPHNECLDVTPRIVASGFFAGLSFISFVREVTKLPKSKAQ